MCIYIPLKYKSRLKILGARSNFQVLWTKKLGAIVKKKKFKARAHTICALLCYMQNKNITLFAQVFLFSFLRYTAEVCLCKA